uniref:Lysophospholipase D GDPD3 n=1 Tax=Suricata suricatta TaxID=37032 RepID=A0A673VN44_SURSU
MSSLLYYALPALGSYAMLSIFFLRRPRLLHTPRAPVFLARLGAHRAGSGERLENTMEAMENSMAQRSDFLELDCQLTQDGVVVVSHDKNLSRQSGVNRDMDSLDFKDLPLYKEELEVYFSPGQFAQGSDRRMVCLEDVFRRFPRMPMSVEIKEDNEELINKVADLVRHFDRNEITIWASVNGSVMNKCRAANPEMPFSFTIGRAFWMVLFYYLGLLPFASIPERFFLCFLPTIINRLLMRKSLIHHLQQRGVQRTFVENALHSRHFGIRDGAGSLPSNQGQRKEIGDHRHQAHRKEMALWSAGSQEALCVKGGAGLHGEEKERISDRSQTGSACGKAGRSWGRGAGGGTERFHQAGMRCGGSERRTLEKVAQAQAGSLCTSVKEPGLQPGGREAFEGLKQSRDLIQLNPGLQRQQWAGWTSWLMGRALHSQDVGVVFWCLNEESDFEVAYGLGAVGVMTDYPTALRCYLDNHGGAALAS